MPIRHTCNIGAIALTVLSTLPIQADEWAAQSGVVKEFHVVKVEPLITYDGGIVRVIVDSVIPSTSCAGQTVGDIRLGAGAPGTTEARSAAVSASYMALAANKTIRLFLSTSGCSAGGVPIILGLDVVN